jgi:hypothetical protein
MALQFEHSDAVEYARGFSKKSMLCLYVQAKALGCKKKLVVPLRPIDGAGVPKKAWFDLYLPQV